jgi:hypothetical protein
MTFQELQTKSFSQAKQDIFALYINNFKKGGYFIDLGCNEPFVCSNSYLLELAEWKGFLVDYNPDLVRKCQANRKNTAIHADLTKMDISTIMAQQLSPEIIDFVSMDLDDDAAWPCIQDFDFDKYKIKCMTFEHDAYLRGNKMRDLSRDFLTGKGLKMVCADVTIFGGKSFEDWYVNPELVSQEVYEKIICEKVEFSDIFNNL